MAKDTVAHRFRRHTGTGDRLPDDKPRQIARGLVLQTATECPYRSPHTTEHNDFTHIHSIDLPFRPRGIDRAFAFI
jgi:hypothetical protein